jgi:hypothetical protein
MAEECNTMNMTEVQEKSIFDSYLGRQLPFAFGQGTLGFQVSFAAVDDCPRDRYVLND